jgi:uncharacterized membrane protein
MTTNADGSDTAPWIGLNLCLSVLAGLQGAIILIAQKRENQISDERAEHDHKLLARIAEKVGADR